MIQTAILYVVNKFCFLCVIKKNFDAGVVDTSVLAIVVCAGTAKQQYCMVAVMVHEAGASGGVAMLPDNTP